MTSTGCSEKEQLSEEAVFELKMIVAVLARFPRTSSSVIWARAKHGPLGVPVQRMEARSFF